MSNNILLKPDITSSPPFQLATPSLPSLRSSTNTFSSVRRLTNKTEPSSSSYSERSTSPTRTTSPDLPPLPRLSKAAIFQPHKFSSPPQQKSDSTYYTALWGSPYELPSSSRAKQGESDTKRRNSILSTDGSPIRYTKAIVIPEDGQHNLKGGRFIRRSYTSNELSSSPSIAQYKAQVSERKYDLTGDWIRNYKQERVERRTWFSDESDRSGESDAGDFEDSILSPTEFTVPTDPKTPKASLLNRPAPKANSPSLKRISPKGHHPRGYQGTLTQQDFNQLLGTKSDPASKGPKMLSALMSGAIPKRDRRTSSNAEKALPPPPVNRTASEYPDAASQGTNDTPPQPSKRPSISSTASFQRPKKKLIFRGKGVMISLPIDPLRYADGNLKVPLTPEEVAAHMHWWEEQGYSNRGFDLNEDWYGNPAMGQSRAIWPDADDARAESQSSSIKVRIPSDRKAFDEHVNQLMEEKLRALGVTTGDEEPPRASPAIPPMSRQASSQNSLAPSLSSGPSVPNQLRGRMDSTFSPPLTAPNSQFPFAQPLVSPGSVPVNPRSAGFHAPHQSLAFPPGKSQVSGAPFQAQLPPLPGHQGQQQYLGSVPSSRGVSPLVDGRRQSIRISNSPVSPLPDVSVDGYFNGLAQLPPHLRQQPGYMHPALMQQQAARPQPPPPMQRQVSETQEQQQQQQQPIRYVSQPEIASPLPQGHRHNVSETLQKEIDDAEAHLEASIARQLKDSNEKTEEMSRIMEAKSPGKPEAFLEEEDSPNSKTAVSDIDTNPSLVNSPMPGSAVFSSSDLHTPKTSNSKLNVKAQEFKFDPAKPAFAPMFTFGDNSGTTSGPTSAKSASGVDGLHSKTTSNTSTFSSGLNVTAPAFVPSKTKPQIASAPNNVFSFSSSMPTAKPSGLSSTPGYAFNSGLVESARSKDKAPKIFSNFVQPTKTSKAIPIVPPTTEEPDDVDGRMQRPSDQLKKARRADKDGDQIPLFAAMPDELASKPEAKRTVEKELERLDNVEKEPSPKLQSPKVYAPETAPDMEKSDSLQDTEIDVPLNTADFLDAPNNPASPHSSTGKATDDLKALVDDITSSEKGTTQAPTQIQGPVDDPFAVEDEDEGGVTDKSKSHSRLASPSVEKPDALSNNVALAPHVATGADATESAKRSVLSPAAKPFSFNPIANDFKLSMPSDKNAKPSPTEDSTPVKPASAVRSAITGGLGASRYAVPEVLKSLSQSSSSLLEPTPEAITSPVLDPPPESPIDRIEDMNTEIVQEATPEISSTAGFPMSPRQDSPTNLIDERILNGVQYVQPPNYHKIGDSMQEIDSVMQQFGDDSDVGVERNPAAAWRSPVRRATDEHKYTPAEDIPTREYASDADHKRLRKSELRATSSPNRLSQPFQYLPVAESSDTSESANKNATAEIIARNARYSPSFKKPRRSSASFSPVRRLNRKNDNSISEWDDVVSSGEEEAFNQRVGFFDNRVSHVIANAIEDRLQPLESAIATLSTELMRRSERSRSRRLQRSTSAGVENSDADDEDEEVIPGRAVSPFLKDRKFEKLRSLLLDVVNSQRPAAAEDNTKVLDTLAELKSALSRQQQEPDTSKKEMGNEAISKITEAIGELKTSLASQPSQPVAPSSLASEEVTNMTKAISQLQESIKEHKGRSGSPQDIKFVIEEAISKHMRGKSATVRSSEAAASVEKLQLQINGLESMLKIQQTHASEEYKLRRELDDKLAASERDLKNALAEAAQNRDIAADTEASLRSFLDEHQQSKQHTATLEEVKFSLEKTISDLSDKNNALEETISEYRISHDDWRAEIDEAKATNEDLQRTISSLKDELEDGISAKQSLKDKLERMQEDMTTTVRNVAQDQAAWRYKDEEHKAKHEISGARLEAEARTRERLELEIERLEKQEREAMKSRFLVEQVRNENQNLSSLVNDLRSKSHQYQERSMTLERELHDTKERAHLEVQRIMTSTKGDVEAANQQVELLRANLEAVISRLETQLGDAKNDSNLAKERYELMLEEASVSKDTALREAAEAREAALQEHYRFHERTLGDERSSHERALTEMRTAHGRAFENTVEDHKRALHNMIEDRKRALHAVSEEQRITEQELKGKLSLSDEKIVHLQDKSKHLEERLEIAKSAAQAAADAARSARSSTPQPASQSSVMPSMPITRNSQIPDKISPQALRESILVLQEQLHERESRIEKLEQQLSEVDHDAPNKIKERDIEIGWLRELLGVRLDDLQDIITSLSSPSFNREAVRDAVIRLRANLQMEQQEKERAMASGRNMPSISSIAASPRSLPMAAAAAWGNWRKGQGSLSSLAEMAVPSVASSVNQTPSRSSPQSFLSGLLTPPNTNVRHTPQPRQSASRPTSSSARRPLGGYSTPKRQLSNASYDSRRPLGTDIPPPETPPLLRKNNYDADAHERSHHYSLDRYATEPPSDGEIGEDALDNGGAVSALLPDEQSTSGVSSDAGRSSATTEGPEGLFGPSIELAG